MHTFLQYQQPFNYYDYFWLIVVPNINYDSKIKNN